MNSVSLLHLNMPGLYSARDREVVLFVLQKSRRESQRKVRLDKVREYKSFVYFFPIPHVVYSWFRRFHKSSLRPLSLSMPNV